MQNNTLYKEIINEIAKQTEARCGVNIFAFKFDNMDNIKQSMVMAYGGYNNLTKGNTTALTTRTNQTSSPFSAITDFVNDNVENFKDKVFGYNFKTYSIEILADIKAVQEAIKKGEKILDSNKHTFILQNYEYEVKKFNFDSKELRILETIFIKNAEGIQTITEAITINLKNHKIVKGLESATIEIKEIINVIENGDIKDIEKYIKNIESLKLPYEQFKQVYEKIDSYIKTAERFNNEAALEKIMHIKVLQSKLHSNNLTNALMITNPKAGKAIKQTFNKNAKALHTGFSDALIAALSTLANGIVREIKDMCSGKTDSEKSVMSRIKRLIREVIESFRANFVRGANFSITQKAHEILDLIFKNISSKMKQIYKNIKEQGKVIYNSIVSYIKGEIKDMKTLLKTILKGLATLMWVPAIATLEAKLSAILPFGFLLAPILAIVAGAFAVVITVRSIDLAFDALFSLFAQREASRLRAEEIAALVAERLPAIIAKREALQKLIAKEHKERMLSIESSFSDYKSAVTNADSSGIYSALNGINKLFGKELRIKNLEDVKTELLREDRTGMLKW